MVAVIALVLGTAGPALAAEVDGYHCDYAISPPGRTWVGNVVVGTGGLCLLTGWTITGDLVVERAGVVYAKSVTVQGDVIVGVDGWAELDEPSVVQGGILVDNASWLGSYGHVWHSIRGSARTVGLNGDIDGAVNLDLRGPTPGSFNATANIGGWVNLVGGEIRMLATDMGRGLTLTEPERVRLCIVHVASDLLITRAHGTIGLGDDLDDTYWCSDGRENSYNFGPVDVGGTLTLRENYHSAVLGLVTVAGDLQCAGNSGPRGITIAPAPDVVVTGARSGQCA